MNNENEYLEFAFFVSQLIRFILSDYPNKDRQHQKKSFSLKKGKKRIEQEYGSHLYQYASG